jgi:hypothetical protein
VTGGGELQPDQFETGYFLGILAGEGHFGGDGRQPHITLRMHVRHARLFEWLVARFPGGRLYGPYHSAGRHYYQWMVRGPYLRATVAPLIARHAHVLDDHVRGRFEAMCERYGLLESAAALDLPRGGGSAGSSRVTLGAGEAVVPAPAARP